MMSWDSRLYLEDILEAATRVRPGHNAVLDEARRFP